MRGTGSIKEGHNRAKHRRHSRRSGFCSLQCGMNSKGLRKWMRGASCLFGSSFTSLTPVLILFRDWCWDVHRSPCPGIHVEKSIPVSDYTTRLQCSTGDHDSTFCPPDPQKLRILSFTEQTLFKDSQSLCPHKYFCFNLNSGQNVQKHLVQFCNKISHHIKPGRNKWRCTDILIVVDKQSALNILAWHYCLTPCQFCWCISCLVG